MANTISIIIFGITGDLAHRKLIPALFNNYQKNRLTDNFRIVGFAGREWSDEHLRDSLHEGLSKHAGFEINETIWQAFAEKIYYFRGDFDNAESCEELAIRLEILEEGSADRLFYLATPPKFIPTIIGNMGRSGLTKENGGWRRVVIEKPFGTSLESARRLNQDIHRVLREDQIYRIDHYLGKETVQNILVIRFANTIFEPIWNRNYIDNVQITVAEKVGLENRAKYYDAVGVLRDMFQNHLLQLLSLVAMEPPSSYRADDLRDEKAKVLKAIRQIPVNQAGTETIRGQYRGYREEEGVSADTKTATYAAVRFYVDNWRWQSVPFYVRSGKQLTKKLSEIVIQFKKPPHLMFPLPESYEFTSNKLILYLQPDEGIQVRFETKVPDTVAETRSVNLDYHYKEAFGEKAIPEAYERLLLDALTGDASLFNRSDHLELAWKLLDPILAAWDDAELKLPLALYEPGSWGPKEADAFLAADSRKWNSENPASA